MKLTNKTRQTIIAEDVHMADTAISRLIGLLNRKEIKPEEGLIITHCRSIHMFFMRFAIDVIFVDKNEKVIGLVKNIRPFRMSPYFFRAKKAIELFPGTIDKSLTQVGDVILQEENSKG